MCVFHSLHSFYSLFIHISQEKYKNVLMNQFLISISKFFFLSLLYALSAYFQGSPSSFAAFKFKLVYKLLIWLYLLYSRNIMHKRNKNTDSIKYCLYQVSNVRFSPGSFRNCIQ